MLNEKLIIHNTVVNALSGDQLSTAEVVDFSHALGASLAQSPFNHPMSDSQLASHMKKGTSVVLVEHTSGLLLAHVLLQAQDNGITETQAWYSYKPGFGGEVMRKGVKHGISLGANSVYTSVQTENAGALKTIIKIGGIPIETKPSLRSGKPVTVFNLTHIGKA